MNAFQSFENVAEISTISSDNSEPSLRQVIFIPTALATVMLLVGATTCILAKVNPGPLVLPYLVYTASFSGMAVLGYIFIEIAKLAPRRADRPLSIVLKKVRDRAPFLVLPMLIFPVFMIGFNAAKACIPFLVGFSWDKSLMNADRAIFGDDVWLIAHHLFGNSMRPVFEWLYSTGWGAAFMYIGTLVIFYAKPRGIAIFYATMLLTWFFGGWLAAYCFSAVGPVFVPLFHPDLAKQFVPLRAWLAANLSQDGSVRMTQAYLAAAIYNHSVVKGAGISAMPSMHLAQAAVYVFASLRTRWFIPAAVFWILIFAASGYFGYHYWVDGIAAFAITGLSYWASTAYFSERAPRARIASAIRTRASH